MCVCVWGGVHRAPRRGAGAGGKKKRAPAGDLELRARQSDTHTRASSTFTRAGMFPAVCAGARGCPGAVRGGVL